MEIKKVTNSNIVLFVGFALLFLVIYAFNGYNYGYLAGLGAVVATLLFSSLTIFALSYFISFNTKEKIFYTLVVAITNQILLKTPFSFITEIISWSSLIALIVLIVTEFMGIKIARHKK